MQSTLHNNSISLFPDLTGALGPLTKTRQSRVIFIYLMLYVLGAILVFGFPNRGFSAFGHSLAFPGSGFMGGWTLDAPIVTGLILFGLSLAALGLAGFLWFATGNVVLPPFVWIAVSVGSYFWQDQKLDAEFAIGTSGLAFTIGPVFIGGLYVYRYVTLQRGRLQRRKINALLIQDTPKIEPSVKAETKELSLAELKHMRLLLDRALQPVDQFEGFEWIDQFQTSAVRYQINFISYALSLAQANYMPDFTGYLSQAQRNLKAKQENHRIWKYWQAENIWGNLRPGADPIARDNIMYSGFVGAQLAYARQSGPRDTAQLDGLNCRNRGEGFSYTQDEMIRALVAQYSEAKFGLLSCEPNWVYPLCNAITATAIRAHDTQTGTTYWDSISDDFRRSLETEFITPSGKFIPFRSNYTGFAPPQIGGAVMQAFPCFFLNSVLPDIARRHWKALKIEMDGKNWRKTLWPVDVGNYGFSRASSYAATALAAREMGDHKTADLLLDYLDDACPKVENNGIIHNSRASLWANANAFMAKTSQENALRNLVTTTTSNKSQTPYLADVDPLNVLIAKARYEKGALSIIAYPSQFPGFKALKIAGLVPHARYHVNSNSKTHFKALSDGTQIINFPLNGRTEIIIRKVI